MIMSHGLLQARYLIPREEMKNFEFDKFIKDIDKKEKPKREIKEAPETPQEKLLRRGRENYRHRVRWEKKR